MNRIISPLECVPSGEITHLTLLFIRVLRTRLLLERLRLGLRLFCMSNLRCNCTDGNENDDEESEQSPMHLGCETLLLETTWNHGRNTSLLVEQFAWLIVRPKAVKSGDFSCVFFPDFRCVPFLVLSYVPFPASSPSKSFGFPVAEA